MPSFNTISVKFATVCFSWSISDGGISPKITWCGGTNMSTTIPSVYLICLPLGTSTSKNGTPLGT